MPARSIKARRGQVADAAARVAPVGREEFRRRRRALMKHMGRDSIAIVPTAPVRLRNNDVEYAYRPDSDFYYLTGFAEPESVAVLIPHRAQGEYILFVRDRDPARETWDGRRAGPVSGYLLSVAPDGVPDPGLEILLYAKAERLELDPSGAVRGIEYAKRDGLDQSLPARTGFARLARDGVVVLASGALITPRLLLRSGVETSESNW